MASRKKKKKNDGVSASDIFSFFVVGFVFYCISLIWESEHRTAIIVTIIITMIVFIIAYSILKEKIELQNVNNMSGYKFEEWCAERLKEKGFKRVKVTPKTGDYGADIVAIDKHGEKWVIQCKRQQTNVSNSAVQEVVAAKAHYKADKAAVMTNSKLTKKAKELAWENAVEIMEGLGNW